MSDSAQNGQGERKAFHCPLVSVKVSNFPLMFFIVVFSCFLSYSTGAREVWGIGMDPSISHPQHFQPGRFVRWKMDRRGAGDKEDIISYARSGFAEWLDLGAKRTEPEHESEPEPDSGSVIDSESSGSSLAVSGATKKLGVEVRAGNMGS